MGTEEGSQEYPSEGAVLNLIRDITRGQCIAPIWAAEKQVAGAVGLGSGLAGTPINQTDAEQEAGLLEYRQQLSAVADNDSVPSVSTRSAGSGTRLYPQGTGPVE